MASFCNVEIKGCGAGSRFRRRPFDVVRSRHTRWRKLFSRSTCAKRAPALSTPPQLIRPAPCMLYIAVNQIACAFSWTGVAAGFDQWLWLSGWLTADRSTEESDLAASFEVGRLPYPRQEKPPSTFSALEGNGEINAMPRSLALEDNGSAALKRRGALISYCSTGWWSQDGKKLQNTAIRLRFIQTV